MNFAESTSDAVVCCFADKLACWQDAELGRNLLIYSPNRILLCHACIVMCVMISRPNACAVSQYDKMLLG